MKIFILFILSFMSSQAYSKGDFVEEQIKKLSSQDTKIRIDGAFGLDSYFTSNGSTADPKEIDKYIVEFKKALKDSESAVVQFITHIMGARPLVDKNTMEVYYYLNRTTPEIRESVLSIVLSNLESKNAWISSRSATVLINSARCEYEIKIRNRIALSTQYKFMFKEQEKQLDNLCKQGDRMSY